MFKLVFSPSGAINRKQFLLGILALILIAAISQFVVMIIEMIPDFIQASKSGPPDKALILAGNTPSSIVSYIPIWLWILLCTWGTLCLMIKRLRDMALSPWLLGVPVILGPVAYFVHMPIIQSVAYIVTIALYLLCFFFPTQS